MTYDASSVMRGQHLMVWGTRQRWLSRGLRAVGKGATGAAATYFRQRMAKGFPERAHDPGESSGTLGRAIAKNYQVVGGMGEPYLGCASKRRFPPYWTGVNYGSMWVGNGDGSTDRYAETPWGLILIERHGKGHWEERFTHKGVGPGRAGKTGDGDDWVEGSGAGNYGMVRPGVIVRRPGYNFIKFLWKDGVRRMDNWSHKIWHEVAAEVTQ